MPFFYTPKPDVAYIRTGGLFSKAPKIATTNLLLKLPIIHAVTPINLRSFGVNVKRVSKECLRAKDVFVDIQAVFTMQINSHELHKAAETFGQDTFTIDNNQLIHNILDGILREVTATMSLDELQEKRTDFVNNITAAAVEKFVKLGLTLLNTTILTLEQTGIEYVNTDDILGARTSAITMQEIQKNKKIENDALRENEVLIATKNNAAEIQKIDLDVELKNKIVDAEKKQVEFAKDKQIAIAKATAEQETASQTTLIQKDIVIIQKNEEKLLSEEKLATAQEKTNEAVIRAETVRLKGIKEREKEIAIIEANQKAEAIQIQVETQAKADARKNQLEAEAHLFKINKEAEAMERLALAKEKNYVVEAEGILKRNEAENKLDAKIIEYKQKMKLIETLPAIIEALVKPMESIKDIKVISVNGLNNAISNNQNQAVNNSGNNVVNDVYNGALQFKVNSSMVNNMLKDIGINMNSENIGDLIPNISIDNKTDAK
jgi:uncharacterized membrane protein YqiK